MISIQVIIIFLFTTLGTYLASRLEKKKKLIFFIPTIAALIGFFISFSIDEIGKIFAKPVVTVSTKRTESMIIFEIQTDKKNIDSITLDYPIVGHITDFQSSNPISDVYYSVWAVGGPNMPYLMNRLELLLENIAPNKKLNFEAFYKPIKLSRGKSISFMGSDRYEINFNWMYKGEKYNSSQWRLVENDKLTVPPLGRVGVIQYYKDYDAKFNPITPKRRLNK